MLLRDLVTVVTRTPHLGNISLDDLFAFIHLTKLVRPHIEVRQHDITHRPAFLPHAIHEFLGATLRKSLAEVAWYWHAFRNAVWTGVAVGREEDIRAFSLHGLSRSIGTSPPISYISNTHMNIIVQGTAMCSPQPGSAFALNAATIVHMETSSHCPSRSHTVLPSTLCTRAHCPSILHPCTATVSTWQICIMNVSDQFVSLPPPLSPQFLCQ